MTGMLTYDNVDSFMIVDCGGGTVDLTTRRIQENGKRLGEVAERMGACYGSTFVDLNFVKYLGEQLGVDAIERLKVRNRSEYHSLVQKFCEEVKHTFSGERSAYETYYLEISRRSALK